MIYLCFCPLPQSLLGGGAHLLRRWAPLIRIDYTIEPTSWMVLNKYQIMTTKQNNKWRTWSSGVKGKLSSDTVKSWSSVSTSAAGLCQPLCSGQSHQQPQSGCDPGLSRYRRNTQPPQNTSQGFRVQLLLFSLSRGQPWHRHKEVPTLWLPSTRVLNIKISCHPLYHMRYRLAQSHDCTTHEVTWEYINSSLILITWNLSNNGWLF